MTRSRPFLLPKIIATVGPACRDVEVLSRLIEEGVRVLRINFSHGTFDDFAAMLDIARQASARVGIEVAVFGDLSGPKIRVGAVKDGGVTLKVGDTFRLQRQATIAQGPVFSTTAPQVLDDIQIGHRVLIDDGAVRALATESDADGIIAIVTTGGLVTSKKGINLPDSDLKIDAITEYDWTCVDWSLAHDIDFLALSFVRSAKDVLQLKEYVRQHVDPARGRLPITAKIEKPQAVDDLPAIMDAADAVMVARGDLGVEMDLAQVPVIQKRIVQLAHDYGKPVMVATQMLQSMIHSSSPTRAEASDVANAIYEGADAVMLSGETAVGHYPFEAVNTMARIALQMQQHVASIAVQWGRPPRKLQESQYRTAALAHGVATVARDLGAKLIVVWSQRGGGARYLSQNRTTLPIIAATSDRYAMRRMCPLFAVHPVLMDKPASVEAFVTAIDRMILDNGWAAPGDPILVVTGEPIGMVRVTNQLRIHFAGDMCRLDGDSAG